MSELMISRAFVKKLASNIRVTYGKEVKHTDAIELVAGSLGWKADALMHKLKLEETAQSAEVPNLSAETEVKHKKVNSRFENIELLTSFVHAIIYDKLDVAEEYAPLISDESAWCCFALGLYHHILDRRGKSSYLDSERYLVKAFRLDAETVKYAAQIVNVPFGPSSEGASLFQVINHREYDGGYTPQSRFVRGDLMAWATRVAQERGFLINTESGPVVKEKPDYHDRKFKYPIDKLREFSSDEFWHFMKDGTENRSISDKIDQIRSIYVRSIGGDSLNKVLSSVSVNVLLDFMVGLFDPGKFFSLAKDASSVANEKWFMPEFYWGDICRFVESLPGMEGFYVVDEDTHLPKNSEAQLTKEAEAILEEVCSHVRMKIHVIFA